MTLKIGKKIKELRRQQDITQEKLADYLNISYQAVSKWENGLALPDITLLPKLANFFGVSTDELLDLKPDENDAELRKYEKEDFELGRKGKVLEKIELSRNVLNIYPRNYQWMLNLAYALVSYNSTNEQQEYSKEHKFIEEAISLCERILEDCTVDTIRHSAIQILCYNYPIVDRKKDAIRLAENMPNMLLSKEMLLSHIYTGKERLKQEQNNLRFMIHFCSSILYLMAWESDLSQGFTADERIEILKTAIQLNKMMLGDDEKEVLYSGQLYLYHFIIARFYCEKNLPDKVFEYLFLAEKYARNCDDAMCLGEQNDEALFFNQITWNRKNILTNTDKTFKEQLLYNIKDSCFDCMRDKEEFRNLQNRLYSAQS